MGFPQSVCYGNEVSGTTKVQNTSQCESGFRIKYDSWNGTDTSDVVKLKPNEQHNFSFSVPSMPNSASDIKQTLQLKVGSSWKDLDTKTSTIKPNFSNFQFVSTPFPSYVQPGKPVAPDVTIENTGKCPGKVNVKSSVLGNQTYSLHPGDTANYRKSITMPGGQQDISIALNNVKRNIQSDTFGTTIKPEQTTIINLNQGTLTAIGGFSSPVRYAGFMQGRNISSKSLDSSDHIAGGMIQAEFSGQVSTDPSDKDIITFDSLKYLSGRFENSLMWVLNNKLQGKAQTFEYSTYPVSIARKIFPSVTNNPDISIQASPSDRLSSIRQKLGINSLVKNPPLRRVQKNL